MRAALMALTERNGVALDAGDLHQPAHRVAGQAQVVLHADLGGVLHLRRRAAQHGAQAPAAMLQATPTSPWQPTSAPLMLAFSL
jgi:hypothetical protein